MELKDVALQESHDALAHALTEFADQILRGSHGPTRVQWLAVSHALAVAAPLMESAANPQWAADVSTVIATQVVA